MVTIGSLCTGYGGLDDAISGRVAWFSEIDRHASVVAARHYPDAPNLGDLTRITWENVPRVDVITAGYPCQPFSLAGKRRGVDDERHIWPHIAHAIGVVRPGAVLLENVSAHLRLGFDTVLADLAEIGYDARWTTVRASDAGACHQRERLFIVAYPADTDSEFRRCLPTATRPAERDHAPGDDPRTSPLMPTPTVVDMGARKTVAEWDAWTAGLAERFRNTNGHGASLSIEARRLKLLVTPTASLGTGSGKRSRWYASGVPDGSHNPAELAADWAGSFGPYAPAVTRWTNIIGRPPPDPEQDGRLSAPFVEWMMGLEPGRVTDSGIPYSQQLKVLGNGVVPQQAAYAVDLLTSVNDDASR